jgi:hypothetical protein
MGVILHHLRHNELRSAAVGRADKQAAGQATSDGSLVFYFGGSREILKKPGCLSDRRRLLNRAHGSWLPTLPSRQRAPYALVFGPAESRNVDLRIVGEAKPIDAIGGLELSFRHQSSLVVARNNGSVDGALNAVALD